jgi:V/A-type H+-transporting ATPase subunit C
MRQLSKYSFANAKIRAMLSFLLDPATFTSMLEVVNRDEVIELLRKTPYAYIFEGVSSENFDISRIERALFRHDIALHQKLFAMLSGQPEKDFVALLLQRYEIEELKVVLRIWHKKAPVDLQDYIVQRVISFDIDFKKVLAAPTIEEIILLLDHTPYKNALMSVREKYRAHNASFYLESGLDLDYYNRLNEAIKRFTGVDRGIAARILGIEIDIQNINWLVRLRKYYSLGIGEMLEWFIPGGAWIAKDRVRDLYVSDGLTKVVESVSLGPYARIKEMAEGNMAAMEAFLYSFLLQEVKKALAGFPFTVGTVLGYLVLKHRETRNIISILNAKQFGWDKERILPLLNL